jgi:hypothetical protein
MTEELVIERARLLCLLRDYSRAKRARCIPHKLERALAAQRALVMRMEAARC